MEVGFGGLFVAAITCIILFSMFSVFVNASTNEAMRIKNNAVDALENRLHRYIHTDINLDSLVRVPPLTNIYRAKLDNKGNTRIPVADFPRCDVIVIYYISPSQTTTVYLTYDPTSPYQYNSWRLESVSHDYINPIRISSSPTGLWDPSEGISIEILLSQSPVKNLPFTIIFVTPDGVIAQGTFTA
jgi:hypothetical protein